MAHIMLEKDYYNDLLEFLIAVLKPLRTIHVEEQKN